MSFLDAFKSSMVDIVEEAKRGNDIFADSLLDPLFDRLDEELGIRSNFELIHTSIADINMQLSVVLTSFRNEGVDFYKLVANDSLRDGLIKFYANYLQSFSVGNYPLACKSVFQQIDLNSSYYQAFSAMCC